MHTAFDREFLDATALTMKSLEVKKDLKMKA